MRILMVMTSHDRLGHTRQKTGVWLEEFAAPYYVFKDADVELTLASPKGGKPPIDPCSETPNAQTPATRHFKGDKDAQAAFSASSVLRTVAGDDFDAVFYPGGHGPLWDLAEDRASIDLIEVMWFEEKFVAAVCHGPGVFRHTKKPDGTPLVKAKSITGFANTEEEAVGLTHVVPFLVEEMLRANGGLFSKAENWHPHVVIDGNLVTGQNPASSEPAAKTLLHLMTRQQLSLMLGGAEPVPPFTCRPEQQAADALPS